MTDIRNRSGHVDNYQARFNLASAKEYAGQGRLEEWVHLYLNSGLWANHGFSKGLKLQKRWWDGPLEVRLSKLIRCSGPEPDMEYRIDTKIWAERTVQMSQSLKELTAVPPLIVEYRQGEFSVRDGNNRHEAMRLKGWERCWVIIWYNRERDYEKHTLEIKEGTLL